MPQAPEPGRGARPKRPGLPDDEATESYPVVPGDPETETVVFNKPGGDDDARADPEDQQSERRFTAPGFDARETAIIATPPEPATEVFASPPEPDSPTAQLGVPPVKPAVPQSIPPRLGAKLRTSRQFNWGWVLTLVVLVLALAAIAILGTVLLTRARHSKAFAEDRARYAIESLDTRFVAPADVAGSRTIALTPRPTG